MKFWKILIKIGDDLIKCLTLSGKLDSSGDLVWQTCQGGSAAEMAFQVVQTSDGGYLVNGNTFSINGNVSCNHGNTDIWVINLIVLVS